MSNAISNEELIQENQELKQRLDKLENLLSNLLQQTPSKKEDVEKEIKPDDYIRVRSLCPYTLNLSTRPVGERGQNFRFVQFGEVKRILYSALVDVMDVNRVFLEQGYFYIENAEVIRKHGLDDTYNKILTYETIERILALKNNDAVEMFKNGTAKQQEFIVNFLINKIKNGENVDMNFVDSISKISGVKITEVVEDKIKYEKILKTG